MENKLNALKIEYGREIEEIENMRKAPLSQDEKDLIKNKYDRLIKEKPMENKLIRVCDNCNKASCWYGEFMCEESRNAGLELKTVKEWRELDLENEEYWSDKYMLRVYGEENPFGFEESE